MSTEKVGNLPTFFEKKVGKETFGFAFTLIISVSLSTK